MKRITVTLFFMLWVVLNFAQSDGNELIELAYLQIVSKYHPVIKLSDINIDKSATDIQFAKGTLDPMISNSINDKSFANTNYYQNISPSISIPTWYGVEFIAGYESLGGSKVDPTETFGGSSFLGASVPLAKNLLFDKRRAMIQKSKVYNQMAKTERQIVVNDILQEAIHAYWDWVKAYVDYQIILRNFNASKSRFEFVKKSHVNGERPVIDTVEALTQLQSFELLKNEGLMYFQNKGIELSAYLWKDDNVPYQLPLNTFPGNNWEENINSRLVKLSLDELLNTANVSHPYLNLYAQKIDILKIEKKARFQDLLPKLDFKYNHLAKNLDLFSTSGLFFQNNFKYGLKFEMPLFFNQGRANYKKAKLDIQEMELTRVQKMQDISIKVRKHYNEYQTYFEQVSLQNNMLNNFNRMLQAEETLFSNGESSLFLVNSRELKVLETERKLIELKTKLYKSSYTLQWSAGLLKEL
jgi:outer membrane protein TolC